MLSRITGIITLLFHVGYASSFSAIPDLGLAGRLSGVMDITIRPEQLALELVHDLEYSFERFTKEAEFMRQFQGPVACDACSVILGPVDAFLTNEVVIGALEAFATEFCVFMKIEQGDRAVCSGGVKLMTPSVLGAIV